MSSVKQVELNHGDTEGTEKSNFGLQGEPDPALQPI